MRTVCFKMAITLDSNGDAHTYSATESERERERDVFPYIFITFEMKCYSHLHCYPIVDLFDDVDVL